MKTASDYVNINDQHDNNHVQAKNYNMESIVMIFYENTPQASDDWKQMETYLRSTSHRIFYFTEMSSMITHFETNIDEKIFVILRGTDAVDIVPKVHLYPSVESIFILSFANDENQLSSDDYSKIVGTYQTIDQLDEVLSIQSRFVLRRLETFAIFKNQRSIKDMPKQFAHYVWFQMFNEVILQLSHGDQDKQQMIEFCRQYYHENPFTLQAIDKFEREYQPSDAIRWYTKQSFIYKILNYALRTEDISLLNVFRYYLRDLRASLIQERIPKEAGTLTLYRGTKLSRHEFDQLKENIGKVLSINGFWSTSRCRTQALTFAPTVNVSSDNFVSVLFEIQCDMVELDETVFIADIAKFSEFPHEQEVLFGLNACFQIESISIDPTVSIVKLRTSNENLPMTKFYLKQTNERIQEFGSAIVYGTLMIKQGNYDEAFNYFLSLSRQSDGLETLHIDLCLGKICDAKAEYSRAENYYNRAYDRLIELGLDRSKYAGQVFQLMGSNFYIQERLEESLSVLQKAHEIWTELFSSEHQLVGKCLNMTALVHAKLCNYDLALKYFKHRSAIQNRCYPAEHISITHYFFNMADVMNDLGKYDEAKLFIEKSLFIRDTYYSKDHTFLASCYQLYGSILYQMRDYENALRFQKRAIEIRNKHYGIATIKIYRSLYHIGNILLQQKDYMGALQYYEKALANMKKYNEFDYINEADCIDGIGHVHCALGQVSEGLHQYRKALRKNYIRLPLHHINIARSLLNIGQALVKIERKKLALLYMRRSLKIFRKHLSDNHRYIVDNLKSLEQISQ